MTACVPAQPATPGAASLSAQAGAALRWNTATTLARMLLQLGAQVVLASARGERVLPLEEFLVDYFTTAIEPDELVVASLLHDVGHLVAPRAEGSTEPDSHKDDVHQYLALPFLRGLFPDSVLEPIRMHVDAKRYLCHAQPGYWETLSPASKHSLQLQGGVFDADQAAAFLAQPYASEAVRLRRYDDQAKTPGLDVPGLDYYVSHLQWVVL